MDAQPDIGKLTEAFTTSSGALAVVADEIAHATNLPAMQRLSEAIDRLAMSINSLQPMSAL